MAIRGLSMIERQAFILSFDPAHPDSIKAAVDRRVESREGANHDVDRNAIEDSVRELAGEPTIFYLGNLTHDDRTYLADMSGNFEQTREGNMRMRNQNTLRVTETVRRGLVGWENFYDDKGNLIPFEMVPGVDDRGKPRKVISPACLSAMTIDMMREVAAEILKINGVTTDLEKKLDGLLRQQSGPHLMDGLAEIAPTTSSENEAAE